MDGCFWILPLSAVIIVGAATVAVFLLPGLLKSWP